MTVSENPQAQLYFSKGPKERSQMLEHLRVPEDQKLLEICVRIDDDPCNRIAALRKLSYPESRETIVDAALHDISGYVQEEAVGKLPYPQEAELLTEIARRPVSDLFYKTDSLAPSAAQGILAKAGICPRCGAAEITEKTYTAYREDDPEVEYETSGYWCRACNWHER